MPNFSYDPASPNRLFADPTDGGVKRKRPDADMRLLKGALKRRKMQKKNIEAGFDRLGAEKA